MSSFDDRLRRVLSEMPVRHFKAAGALPIGDEEEFGKKHGHMSYYASNFKDKSYEGYVSPKYMGTISDKLSRLIGYDINIFVIDGAENEFYDETGEVDSITILSKLTEVPVSELEDAINFIMTGNNAQKEFSPWLYMHQLGEALENECRMSDHEFGAHEAVGAQFVDFYARIEKLVPDWVGRLKMGSAREAKREYLSGKIGAVSIGDLHQELITEFLWHGGRIRFDYPDNVDRREVDALFDAFKSALRQLLDACVGQILVNDVGR